MRRALAFAAIAAAVMTVSAQTLNIATGNVTYQFPAATAGMMQYTNGTQLTVAGKTFNISDITSTKVDDSAVTEASVAVAYSGTSAQVTVSGDIAQYLTVGVKNGHVAIVQSSDVATEITYTLSGTATNGSFYMDGSYKATLVLNGVTLTNPDSAAINIRDGKRIAVTLTDGTTNTLKDGSSGSQKACFAVKGHTEFKGGGTLNITGNTAHAFWGKEYVQLKASTGTINILGAVTDGFHVNQYYQQNGGTVNISSVGDDGIQVGYKTDDNDQVISTTEDEDNTAEFLMQGGSLKITVTAAGCKGIKAEGNVTFNESKSSATVTVTNSGAVDATDSSDPSSSACVKSDANIVIDAGTINLSNSGQGGRAMVCDGTLTINGGNITAAATGTNYSSSSSGGGGGRWGGGGGFGPGGGGGGFGPNGSSSSGNNAKGVKSKGDLTINGGNISIKSTNHEGLESKAAMYLNGGNIYVVAGDDAINSSGNMTIDGAYVYGYGSGSDGLDANGNMYMKSGVAVGFGGSGAESGIDTNESTKLYITGGYLFGIGGRVDANFGTCTQKYGQASSVSCSSGAYFVVYNSTSSYLFAVKAPASYSGVVLCSAPSLASGAKVASATSVSGTATNGVIISPTVSSVSNAKSLTVK